MSSEVTKADRDFRDELEKHTVGMNGTTAAIKDSALPLIAGYRTQADTPDDVAKNKDYNLGFDDGLAIGKHNAEQAQAATIETLREALLNIDALDPERHAAGFTDAAMRGLVEQMGNIARQALNRTGDAKETGK